MCGNLNDEVGMIHLRSLGGEYSYVDISSIGALHESRVGTLYPFAAPRRSRLVTDPLYRRGPACGMRASDPSEASLSPRTRVPGRSRPAILSSSPQSDNR